MIWRCDLLPQYHLYKDELNDAISRVLESGRYILSEEVNRFELEFTEYIGTKYGVGVANATDGLTLALLSVGTQPGDEVITTPFTAIPTVSAIIDAGAIPVFVDVDPETYLIDINQVKGKITKKTKAIMPVHIFGNVVDINQLRNVIESEIPIIEDASQAHGSKINNVIVGSYGEMGIFSFYPSKNLGCYGDGGFISTNSNMLNEKLRLLRMYGMTDYQHIIINGINSRLDELQAAILRVKLKYLDAMNIKRNEIALNYIKNLPDFFTHQKINLNVFSNYHVFASRLKINRKEFMNFLSKHDIQTNIYYLIPLHLQKALDFLGHKDGTFPNAELICKEIIALPMYPELNSETCSTIINVINNF